MQHKEENQKERKVKDRTHLDNLGYTAEALRQVKEEKRLKDIEYFKSKIKQCQHSILY